MAPGRRRSRCTIRVVRSVPLLLDVVSSFPHRPVFLPSRQARPATSDAAPDGKGCQGRGARSVWQPFPYSEAFSGLVFPRTDVCSLHWTSQGPSRERLIKHGSWPAKKNIKMTTDVYRDVDGLHISRIFHESCVRSAMAYKPRPGDVFIVSYPKCGTTWMQHIVYSIYTGGVPPKDMTEFMTRTPFLELLGAEGAVKMPRPGAIKTHLPYHLQPYSPEAKYIYVTRNPYDCCVSFYHHTKSFPAYQFETKSFDEFFEMFVTGKADYGDYFDHQLSWYDHRDDANVLLVTYEDLKKDARSWTLKVAEFLGEEYATRLRENEEVLNRVLKVTGIEFMKGFNEEYKKWTEQAQELTNEISGLNVARESSLSDDLKKPMTGDFVRKGIVGDWRNHFSEDQIKRMKERIALKTRGSTLMDLWKDVELP